MSSERVEGEAVEGKSSQDFGSGALFNLSLPSASAQRVLMGLVWPSKGELLPQAATGR